MELAVRKGFILTMSSAHISPPYVAPLMATSGPNVSGRHSNLRVQAAKQTFSSFDEMLEKSEQPVLVDFYATWCGPCQYMVPILEDVGRRMKDKIRVVKIDTEKYPSIASRYNVQALPTFILFRNGQPFDRLEGAIPADQLIGRD